MLSDVDKPKTKSASPYCTTTRASFNRSDSSEEEEEDEVFGELLDVDGSFELMQS